MNLKNKGKCFGNLNSIYRNIARQELGKVIIINSKFVCTLFLASLNYPRQFRREIHEKIDFCPYS